jgi:alanyl-tRNA synthetase
VRAISFSISDGQLPSNTGAGYVIRRILRRAVRYGYQNLNLKEPFLCELALTLSDTMGGAFPELVSQKELIYKVIKEEELSFFRTLEQGIRRIDALIQTTKQEGKQIISGASVFELYDTFGFPVDLTSLIARENNLEIDEVGFNEELQAQKDRSRAATNLTTDDWVNLMDDFVEEFIGYDYLTAEIKIVKYRKVIQNQKTFFQLVFSLTPFYPEGGGQVGDSGFIERNGQKTFIFDTKRENNLIVHLTEKLPEELAGTFQAVVNRSKRLASACNHSATHLLHHALRTVLGTHVEQKGSLVNANNLRFDFSHFSKVTDEQLAEVESLVTSAIRENILLDERRNTPMEEAKKLGAMALFGEKYGDAVRVIKFGESVELCGGTHVKSTGEIGLFKITTETAVAAGIRRIEAITSEVAENFYKEKTALLENIALTLKNPKDLEKAVNDLITRNNALQKEIEQMQREKAKGIKNELKSAVIEKNGTHVLSQIIQLDGASIKDILFQLKGEYPLFFGVIGGIQDEKCTLSIIVSEELVQSKNLHAGNLVKEFAPLIKGGGGGQPFFATAGGTDSKGLEEALKLVLNKV